MSVSIPQPYHDLDLPLDIIHEILSHLLPCQGLCISNDPDLDSDRAMISALSRTSCAVRDLVLRHIFSRPLHITMTNANACYDQALCPSDLNPRLARALALPLHKFPKIKIIFAPELDSESCQYGDSCQKWLCKLPPAIAMDKQLVAIRAKLDCINRQSDKLGLQFKICFGRLPKSAPRPHFTFSWDGSRGVEKANKTRKTPLWEFPTLWEGLIEWEWIPGRKRPRGSEHPDMKFHVCLPEEVATGLMCEAPWEVWGYPRPSLQKPHNAMQLWQQTWPLCWVDLWEGPFGDAWFMQYYRIRGLHHRFVVTFSRVEKSRDNDSGYVYTARRVDTA